MTNQITTVQRSLGCLLGLAVGDAVGTTLEFKPRGSFTPIDDMVGGGPFNLPPGAWTDDTSMALCLATSLVACNGFDAADQMARYCDWMQNGYLSSIGHCFDIGNATAAALRRYLASGDPFSGSTDRFSAGNGSIMRLAPIPIFYLGDDEKVWYFSAESSRTTHGAVECIDACRLFGHILHRALGGATKDDLLHREMQLESATIVALSRGSYLTKTRDQIKGSGYVVESLEAALWCFAQSDNFRDAVLLAANLGDDADTTAAIVGQIAGAHYGRAGIPVAWLDRLVMRAEIEALAFALIDEA